MLQVYKAEMNPIVYYFDLFLAFLFAILTVACATASLRYIIVDSQNYSVSLLCLHPDDPRDKHSGALFCHDSSHVVSQSLISLSGIPDLPTIAAFRRILYLCVWCSIRIHAVLGMKSITYIYSFVGGKKVNSKCGMWLQVFANLARWWTWRRRSPEACHVLMDRLLSENMPNADL